VVDELNRKGAIVYTCELCGFGYRELETAERCEEYCDTHGSCSPEISREAVYKPAIRVMSVLA